MHQYLRYGLIEDLATVRHIPVGRFWGVRLTVTPLAWLSPVVFLGLRLVFTLLNPNLTAVGRLSEAFYFMIAVEVASLGHAIGHILSGKIVGQAMDELLITATRAVNLYDGDQTLYPGYVHFGRAIGGPLFNLVIVGVCFMVLPLLADGVIHQLLRRVADINLFFGLGSFLPLPSIDGQVIWRELLRPWRARLS